MRATTTPYSSRCHENSCRVRIDVPNSLREFKEMVRALHSAGIEVILDVVYNHTAEGNQNGPTLSFRGIDNASYYWLKPEAPRFYDDFTGCGSTVNITHPRVLQMVMDSLRYWVEVCHVDGFRFDLATTLARGASGFQRNAGFFTAIRQDPVLASVKLVAEPWDLGMGGYQVGAFPSQWSEWNDRYRSAMRFGPFVNLFLRRRCVKGLRLNMTFPCRLPKFLIL